MSTINERIAVCLSQSGLTKTAFAERINVSQQYVSKLVQRGEPSDRTIRDISRAFNVNETWLRTGVGEMFTPITRDEEIAQFAAAVIQDEGSFRQRFVSMLARLGEEEWAVLEKMALDLAEKKKKD